MPAPPRIDSLLSLPRIVSAKSEPMISPRRSVYGIEVPEPVAYAACFEVDINAVRCILVIDSHETFGPDVECVVTSPCLDLNPVVAIEIQGGRRQRSSCLRD